MNRTKSGNALLYASDSCESDDYFECPHGSEDGKCANPATIFNNLVGDQRKHVSFWGMDDASARGGCCSPAYNQENLVWGQAFKMYPKRPALQFATMSSSTKPPAYFVEESDGRLYYNSLVSSSHNCSTAQYCLCKREHKTKHDELDDCFVCPKGYYTDVTNTSVCKSCVIGKYNNFTKGDDETDCEVCPKGRYNEQIHQVLCKICDRGKYADQTERTSEVGCKRCIAGRYNTEIEQKNVSACTKCGVGKYMNSSFLAYN